MNRISQSASGADADSGDDSVSSITLFEKVQTEPFSFGINYKVYKSNM